MVPAFRSSASNRMVSNGVINNMIILMLPNKGRTTVSLIFNRLYCLAIMGLVWAWKLMTEKVAIRL